MRNDRSRTVDDDFVRVRPCHLAGAGQLQIDRTGDQRGQRIGVCTRHRTGTLSRTRHGRQRDREIGPAGEWSDIDGEVLCVVGRRTHRCGVSADRPAPAIHVRRGVFVRSGEDHPAAFAHRDRRRGTDTALRLRVLCDRDAVRTRLVVHIRDRAGVGPYRRCGLFIRDHDCDLTVRGLCRRQVRSRPQVGVPRRRRIRDIRCAAGEAIHGEGDGFTATDGLVTLADLAGRRFDGVHEIDVRHRVHRRHVHLPRMRRGLGIRGQDRRCTDDVRVGDRRRCRERVALFPQRGIVVGQGLTHERIDERDSCIRWSIRVVRSLRHFVDSVGRLGEILQAPRPVDIRRYDL